MRRLEHPQQEPVHLTGPSLAHHLVQEDEFPKQVGAAESVKAGVAQIRLQAVVDGASDEAGQDAEGIHGLVAALFVDAEPSEQRGRGVVKPAEPARYAHAGFVEVGQRSLTEQGVDTLFKGGEGVVELGFYGQEGPFADALSEEVLAHLRDTI